MTTNEQSVDRGDPPERLPTIPDPETGRPLEHDGADQRHVSVAGDSQANRSPIALASHSMRRFADELSRCDLRAKVEAAIAGGQSKRVRDRRPSTATSPSAFHPGGALRAKSVIAVGSGKGWRGQEYGC